MNPQRQTIFVASHPKGRGNCLSAVLASILEMSIDEVIDTTSDAVRDNGFWKSIHDWLAERGLKIINRPVGHPDLQGNYSIGVGPSPRGPFHHAVVCKSGVMVFDPHPSDDGVTEIEYHDLIVEMSDAEKKLWAHQKGDK